MKHWLLAVALICFGSTAKASPYFRIYGWDYGSHNLSLSSMSHPKPVAGAFINPTNVGQTSGGALVPLVTHSPNDGCLLPSFVCEDWSPLAVGGSINAGKLTLDVSSLFNVFPWMLAGAKSIAPGPMQPLLNMGPSSVEFSAGPVWQYQQAQNKGYFLIFTGLALQF